MTINLETYQLSTLLIEAAKIGAKEALAENGLLKDEISQRRAWEIYGRGTIESLRNTGLIKRTGGLGRGSKSTYKRSEIDAVLRSDVMCRGYGRKGVKKALDGIKKPSKK